MLSLNTVPNWLQIWQEKSLSQMLNIPVPEPQAQWPHQSIMLVFMKVRRNLSWKEQYPVKQPCSIVATWVGASLRDTVHRGHTLSKVGFPAFVTPSLVFQRSDHTNKQTMHLSETWVWGPGRGTNPLLTFPQRSSSQLSSFWHMLSLKLFWSVSSNTAQRIPLCQLIKFMHSIPYCSSVLFLFPHLLWVKQPHSFAYSFSHVHTPGSLGFVGFGV